MRYGAGKKRANQLGWATGTWLPPHPLLTPPPPRTMQLLEEHTERAPRISQEFGERMAHCCLGGLAEFLQRYGGLGMGVGIWTRDPTERGQMKVNRVKMGRKGRLCRDPRLCWADCPARDPYPAVLPSVCRFSSHQLPAACGAIP